MENIWYKDLTGFVKLDRLPIIIPNKSMSFAQQLNAILSANIS